MRTGINPEKLKEEKLTYWEHRVLIPVYIPKLEGSYYKESFEVFKLSIHSLLHTINPQQTAITIINNNCTEVVTRFIDDLLTSKKIQKHIQYNQNVGKVYPVLSEIKSIYEEYITIADADVLYMNNWVSETAKIFNHYKKAAMVSPLPCPSAFRYVNNSFIAENFLKLKKGKVVQNKSFDLFMKGVNPPEGFFNGKKWNWRDKQYYVQKKNHKACVGAMHFIATYKTETLKKVPLNRPENVFRGGDEVRFIEKHIDRLGGYRLSTTNTYAYHIGNKIDNFATSYKFIKNTKTSFTQTYKYKDKKPLDYIARTIIAKICIKFMNLKN